MNKGWWCHRIYWTMRHSAVSEQKQLSRKISVSLMFLLHCLQYQSNLLTNENEKSDAHSNLSQRRPWWGWGWGRAPWPFQSAMVSLTLKREKDKRKHNKLHRETKRIIKSKWEWRQFHAFHRYVICCASGKGIHLGPWFLSGWKVTTTAHKIFNMNWNDYDDYLFTLAPPNVQIFLKVYMNRTVLQVLPCVMRFTLNPWAVSP